MIIRKASMNLSLLFLSAISVVLTGCGGDAPSREQLVTKYPDIEQGSLRAENTKILCPLLRMAERSGFFDEEVATESTLTVDVGSVTNGAKEFGCGTLECGAVAIAVGNGQPGDGIDLERLHEASGVAHDCGFTFAQGGTEVSDTVRQATLDRLSELADENGNVVYDDIKTVKLEICAAQGVEMTAPGETEARLIFAYLGGVERGFVPVSDIDRLLHAEMPETKTSSWVNAALLSAVK